MEALRVNKTLHTLDLRFNAHMSFFDEAIQTSFVSALEEAKYDSESSRLEGDPHSSLQPSQSTKYEAHGEIECPGAWEGNVFGEKLAVYTGGSSGRCCVYLFHSTILSRDE